MSYERRIDRLHPALIMFLVDQSESMAAAHPGAPGSKAQAVADQLNRLIYELILRSVKTPREPPRPYFSVDVIGYSTTASGHPSVVHCLPGADPNQMGLRTSPELASTPLRIDRRPGGTNGVDINFPVWLEPRAQGGTPMCAAFDALGVTCSTWVLEHPDSFPPVIVHLSDGDSTDGNPVVWAHRLRSLATDDGHLLLFNVNLSDEPSTPLLFPTSPNGLPNDSARQLFEMSSPLPDSMIANGRSMGLAIGRESRGFAFNADLPTLISFLNVGTSIGRAVR